MQDKPPITKGRGTDANPANRYQRLSVLRDHEEDAAPTTHFFNDVTKSILSENDSPDIQFRFSVNPYRGCEHGCIYCLDPGTPILMGSGLTKPLGEVREGDEVYGTQRVGWYRRYTKTLVSAHWHTTKPAYRITLGDGTELIASADHRFLTERGWKFVTPTSDTRKQRMYLTPNNKLMGTGAFVTPSSESPDYQQGYLTGMIKGDGHLATHRYSREGRTHGDQHQFRLALADYQGLERTRRYLQTLNVPVREFLFAPGDGKHREMRAIRTHARGAVEAIRRVCAWPSAPSSEWQRGFLAGVFDAEGSYSQGILRISNTNAEIIMHIGQAFSRFGFDAVVEHIARDKPIDVVRLRGGMREALRFFQFTQPAISRRFDFAGAAVNSAADLAVVAIEPLPGKRDLVDITTGTGDFIANGVVSHNCYARPSHEYLGFSAGLDFETQIMVKPQASQLLRKALMHPKWQALPLAFSGNTDCYQPGERKLGITRACLEVCAEFLQPVGIITKNALVRRDIDVLQKLAAVGAVHVFISITTLDQELAAKMEPRASRPQQRLDAVKALSDAGIPVGVMTAPIIPGLNDREIPQILKTGKEHGAQVAGWVMVRLAKPLDTLFEDWLARQYPDRKDKVMARIREVRGGKMNDTTWGKRQSGEGTYADQISQLFAAAEKKYGLQGQLPALNRSAFCRPEVPGTQLKLF